MNEKPEWLTDMKVLSLKPGDVLVIRAREGTYLGRSDYEYITNIFLTIYPDNKVVFLEAGLDIGVISPGKQED